MEVEKGISKPKTPKLLFGCFLTVSAPFFLLLLYIMGGKMFYGLSMDLRGVPVEEIFSGIKMPLNDVSPNGKYGIIGNEIYNFKEETLTDMGVRVIMFVNNQYAIIRPPTRADANFGELNGAKMQLYDLESGDIFSIDTIKASSRWMNDVNQVLNTNGEVYRYRYDMMIVIPNPKSVSPTIYLLVHTTDEYVYLRSIPYLQRRECLECPSPSGKYLITKNTVTNLADEIVMSREMLWEKSTGNFFHLRGFSVIGWSEDESGVYASYGKPYLFEFEFMFGLTGIVNLPYKTLFIPIPLE